MNKIPVTWQKKSGLNGINIFNQPVEINHKEGDDWVLCNAGNIFLKN
jgi:hypothetical protein